ncbi:hypothetical protein BO83DRAFT_411380 [Aspergillus eucalypticola CBS 122712]|uniref:Uncharacterized protein n=1 Tax=Aspergillus eucalypticola (strain CBS 122712 / IBT 29274) TaxID=1448314 RepID=A0A317USR4_ASPEC|nr:uncharacterized protein BO83DRAFT_411380 [Aspergillus eucalypticola CBS 122712]PWY64399.1 hypothetical protein BO83DRAFT_411380 [Aspergillus eucalypticola CBS 122712]
MSGKACYNPFTPRMRFIPVGPFGCHGGAMIRHGLSSAQVRHCGGRIGLYPPVGYKLRGGRPGNGYARWCLASASRVTRLNDDIKYLSFCDTWNVTSLLDYSHPVSNAKSPLRLTLCAGVFRPPNRSMPDSARSHLRIPFQVFKSEANNWSCRQPGPLVTHATSLTWGHGAMGKKGVSSGIPTGMPVSEQSLGSLGYPPRRDKRVPAAIILHFIRSMPCKGR